jgi:tetratricopeptide (TPR) repeat protein
MATPTEVLALAAQYHATGNLALAEQFARGVLIEEPANAEALRLLGMISQGKGNLKEAIDYLKSSLTSDKSNPVTWQQLGDILFAAGEIRDGIVYYEQVLRLRPDFGEGYNTLGLAWQSLGEWQRAVACFQQTIRLLPTYAPAYNNLGNAFRKLGQLADAVAAFQQALCFWPHNPDITYNLGNTFHDQRKLDQAVACYRQTLSLKPAYSADLCNSLGTAFKEQGLLDQAISQFKEALSLRPGHAMANHNLGDLAAQGQYQFTPDELNDLKTFLVSGSGSPLERSLSAFALAGVLQKDGAYDEAFRLCQEANSLKKGLAGARNLVYDANAQDALVDRIMAIYSRPYFERTKKWGTNSQLPVFIIGLPFSGVSLVEKILAGHPQVFVADDIGNVYQFITPSPSDKGAGLYTTPLLPNVRVARETAAAYLQRLDRSAHGATRVAIKVLDNFLHLGLIATLFSKARVIHCRRHPLDVCLSCFFHNFRELAWAWSLEDMGAYYRSYEKLVAHWSKVLPMPLCEVAYEDLVQNRATVSRDLLAFCGLDSYDPAFNNSTQPANQSVGSAQGQTIGHWRHYEAHLDPLFQALGRKKEGF